MINILDIEASGFGSNSYPIEVGVVLGSGEQYCSIIRPVSEWQHWDESAEKVHRISRDMLLQYGSPITQVALELNELIGNTTVYSDCWVVDQPWLTLLFSVAGVEQLFHLSDLQNILKEPQMTIWHDVKHQVEKELLLDRHRASSDAKIIQLTYERSKALYQKVPGNIQPHAATLANH